MFDPRIPLVPKGAVPEAERRALETGAVFFAREDAARYRLTGSGRVTCVQGLVTCDVEKPGDDARSFGALLTNKGMIVSPLWITRRADEIAIEAPAAGAAGVEQVLAQSLPPRLCRWENVTEATASVGLYGPEAAAALAKVLGGAAGAGGAADAADAGDAGDAAPPEGRVWAATAAGATVTVAPALVRGAPGYDCLLPASAAGAFARALAAAGAAPASPALMEECRIFAGIPRLRAEIDEKTLPQDVRLEELGAVSYTKGCYLGQETVARVHFRGHPNRMLVGIALEREPGSLPRGVDAGGSEVGKLTSAAWSPDLDRWFALAVVRRTVADGAEVRAGEASGVLRHASWLRSA